MKSRILSTDSEWREYLTVYRHLSGNPVAIDYFRGAQVRAFYDGAGHIVAGYVIHQGPDLRYLGFIPETERQAVLTDSGLARDDFVEITCIWMDPRFIDHKRRLMVYAHCVIDAFRTGKKAILGGCFVWKIAEIQMLALPDILYQGAGSDYVGNRYCWIYFAKRRHILPNLCKALSILTIEEAMKRARGHLANIRPRLKNTDKRRM